MIQKYYIKNMKMKYQMPAYENMMVGEISHDSLQS